MRLFQVFLLTSLLVIAANFPTPSWGQEEELSAPETTEDDLQKSFADEDKAQQEDEINAKNAEELNRKAQDEALSKEKKSHVQVVPYYADDKHTPTLKKITRKGEKVYAIKTSPQKYSGNLRIGPFLPSYLEGDTAGISYQNVYQGKTNIMVNFDLEWQFFQSIGKLGLQSGLGFFIANGFGRFVNNPTIAAEETFTLFVFPIPLSLVYRAHFWDKQPLIPYGGAGGVYYAMAEYRDDKPNITQMFKFGGAAAWQWFAGVSFMLDAFDKEVLWQLDQDYGINHVYLTAGARQIFGLSSIYDFTAMYYEGGFGFEF